MCMLGKAARGTRPKPGRVRHAGNWRSSGLQRVDLVKHQLTRYRLKKKKETFQLLCLKQTPNPFSCFFPPQCFSVKSAVFLRPDVSPRRVTSSILTLIVFVRSKTVQYPAFRGDMGGVASQFFLDFPSAAAFCKLIISIYDVAEDYYVVVL